eukprot:CAMPEP_0194280772 /NCGR_PEP_ID=MMETSP0169-20130528/18709_1 /TAXON_ID=218684 /ORGANISM="Corethron pennatum, Strain L29A3" /LENGTH=325 /DNA_ID=CAMNT_0039025623 /DNA_START=102 /DNA_END=1076 /DNA_ORIENTATION=-
MAAEESPGSPDIESPSDADRTHSIESIQAHSETTGSSGNPSGNDCPEVQAMAAGESPGPPDIEIPSDADRIQSIPRPKVGARTEQFFMTRGKFLQKFKIPFLIMFIVGLFAVITAAIMRNITTIPSVTPSKFPSIAPVTAWPSTSPTRTSSLTRTSSPTPNENELSELGDGAGGDDDDAGDNASSDPIAIPVINQVTKMPAAPVPISRVPSPSTTNIPKRNPFSDDLLFKIVTLLGVLLMLPLFFAAALLVVRVGKRDEDDYDDDVVTTGGMYASSTPNLSVYEDTRHQVGHTWGDHNSGFGTSYGSNASGSGYGTSHGGNASGW